MKLVKGTNEKVKGKKDKENILQACDRNQTCADETCSLLPNKVTLMRKGRRTKPNKKGRIYTGMRAYSYMRSLTSHNQSSQIPNESFHYAYTATT